MPTLSGTLRDRLLTPDPAEATFAKRGFHARDPLTRGHLEQAGGNFLTGFKHAMVSRDLGEAARLLGTVERPYQGFAYEGAAMAFAIVDAVTPWRSARLPAFIAGAADPHVYMANVGAGWAMARLPRPLWRRIRLPDPLLRWLAADGYGFHQAYFATERHVTRREPARPRLPWPDESGYASRAADQGVGRALWFVCGGDVERLAATIGGFGPGRRADLWSGAGLAATYAGGVDGAELEKLRKLASGFRAEVAQGAAFAAATRLRAGLVVPHTGVATDVLCGSSVEEASAITQDTLHGLPADGAMPAYELWRRRIQAVYRPAEG
ncbi:DUF1702 family protein [Actinomadura decatromicini]|uniref:DUF1702 family protein n=1 Tax=Actinomadura decatromicini TaxID=2604572 RepID=A0A5D3FW20_9ACTN|nr:DUF1702 family protein [Actinomadura decatromicini]TYK52511.1 DUF1702 family protein [Actinomadura decatromicini]